jgi:hypothetical protein
MDHAQFAVLATSLVDTLKGFGKGTLTCNGQVLAEDVGVSDALGVIATHALAQQPAISPIQEAFRNAGGSGGFTIHSPSAQSVQTAQAVISNPDKSQIS